MNTDMLTKKMEELSNANLDSVLIAEFTQLTRFVEDALKRASKEDVAGVAETLTASLITLRDYMHNLLAQDSYRKFLLTELTKAANAAPAPEESEQPFQVQDTGLKKSLDLDHQ